MATNGKPLTEVNLPIKNVQSVDKCAMFCKNHPSCDGFKYYGYLDSHETKRGDCYLKKGVTSISIKISASRDIYGGMCQKGTTYSIQITKSKQ